MKIAVLADIHANHVALQACIDYAKSEEIDTFIFLGDYVGDLAYPQKTMELIYRLNEQYKCYFVKGNKEEYWLNYHAGSNQNWKEVDSTTGCLLYTYRNLKERDFSFFEEMSHVQRMEIEGMPSLTICHGSPRNVSEKLLSYDEKCFGAIISEQNDWILCGHSHVRNKFEYAGKTIMNPGSVGVPFQNKGKAQFLILHGEENKWVEKCVDVDYNVEQVIMELYESGLMELAPGWCKVSEHILRNGDMFHSKVLYRAMDLCRSEMGECIWPEIPEKYWTQAVKELL